MARCIDLSLPLEHGQATFPYDPKLSILTHNTTSSIGYNITQISMSTHQGTHLDAPRHFYDEGIPVDAIPLERFFGEATLIDLAPGGALEAGQPLTVDMFSTHAEAFRPGAKVVYRTGWDRAFGRPEYYSDFPSLTLEAAEWMAARHIGLLGMDTPTPGRQWKEIHLALLRPGSEVVIVEALAGLEQLPARFTLAAFPLRIVGRDGSPVRAVAIVED
jgi:arylformamidase